MRFFEEFISIPDHCPELLLDDLLHARGRLQSLMIGTQNSNSILLFYNLAYNFPFRRHGV